MNVGLKNALLSIGFLATFVAGNPVHAQTLRNVELREPAMAATLWKNSSATELQDLARKAKFSNGLMQNSLNVIKEKIKLHVPENQQEPVFTSLVKGSLDNVQEALNDLNQLPTKDVLTQQLRSHFKAYLSLDSSSVVGWSSTFKTIKDTPTFNVERTMQRESVKTLQTLLNNTCAQPQGSIDLKAVNTQCTTRTLTSTRDVMKEIDALGDGLLVGEYEGVPVIVMHDPANALNSAAAYMVKTGNTETPAVLFSLELLEKIKHSPKTMAFILEHELGHVHHQHTYHDDEANFDNEIEADSFALSKLKQKNYTPEDFKNILTTFEKAAYSLGNMELNENFKKMMKARKENIIHQTPSANIYQGYSL